MVVLPAIILELVSNFLIYLFIDQINLPSLYFSENFVGIITLIGQQVSQLWQ